MLYTDVKKMLDDIVQYAYDNHAYIRPNDKDDLLGFRCNVSKKKWQITKKDYVKTRGKREKIIMNKHKVRGYFCRAASCKMYGHFIKELKAYLKSKKWHNSLSPEEAKYVKLVRKYFYLVSKFG